MNIQWLIPIVLSILAIMLFIILLIVKSKNKVKQKQESNEAYNKVRGNKTKIETPRESLESLNKLAKNFFKNYLRLKSELTYLEISEILRKKKESSLVDFCERMDYYLYSGKEITKPEVLAMINQFLLAL